MSTVIIIDILERKYNIEHVYWLKIVFLPTCLKSYIGTVIYSD